MMHTPQCQSWPEPSVRPGKGNTTNIIKQKESIKVPIRLHHNILLLLL